MGSQVITSFEDEIRLYYLVLEGTNEEIGYQLGKLARYQHNIGKTSKVDPVIIQDQYRYLSDQYPEYYSRMSGLRARTRGKG